jgi:hypothetical protein
VYASIIADVVQNIRTDFEEYGMEEELLQILQEVCPCIKRHLVILPTCEACTLDHAQKPVLTGQKWEAKLLETRVADFARTNHGSLDSGDEQDGTVPPVFGTTGPYGQAPLSLPPQHPGYAQQQGPYGVNGNHAPNGFGTTHENGMANGGYPQDFQVKTEPGDDVMRPRGGAVCLLVKDTDCTD